MADKNFGVRRINLVGNSGTPTFDSPNNFRVNANTVILSTDLSIGGQVQSNLEVGSSYSVGIGTTNSPDPIKLYVVGDTNIDGNLRVAENLEASSYTLGGVPLINAALDKWQFVGSDIYSLRNVGIGTSILTQRLTVRGNISAGQFISTSPPGTAPFVVNSDTQVTNLNASFLRGKIPPTGTIVGTTDVQTLTNKTLESPIITGSSAVLNLPIVLSGIAFSGSTSGITTLRPSDIVSGILTLPATTDTLVGRNTTDTLTNKTISASSNTISGITNANLSGSAGITNSNLANSTISGVSLGSNLFSLSFGSGIVASGSYNGSTAITISAVSSGGTWTNTANELVRRDINGDFTAGSITCSYLTASFDINSNSDESLKTNIKQLDNSLQKVNELRGVTFEWKETGKSSIGVIAQDVERVLPELVKQGDVKSVNYNGLIAVLIEAIKDLSNEVEELKKKVL